MPKTRADPPSNPHPQRDPKPQPNLHPRPQLHLLLLRPDFRYFFTGQTVSLLGTAMSPVALAFAVLAASHDKATDLGVVLTAHMVPMLVFLLVGGATADRFARRTVLVWANLGSGLTQGAVAALLLTGHFSLVLVALLELLNGVLAAFTTPALRGFVPELVERHQIQQANALLSSMRNATKIFGPSLSGVLVVAIGGGPAIAFDAATYLFAAICLRLLSSTSHPKKAARTGILADIREGWGQFLGFRWVWTVSATFCLMNLVQTGTWQILGPELTKKTSGVAAWGFVLSARGVGLLVMSTLLTRLTIRRFLAFGQVMSALGAVPLLILGARLPAPFLIAAAFVAGLGSAVASVSWDTSLQEHVPPQSLSRVCSFDDLLSYAAIPIGQLSVGPLAAAFGGFRVVTIAGSIYAAAALFPLAFRPVRRLTHISAQDPAR
ncbi:major facilitator superfamily MFS_1 [Catenulispora acidiphila DSM 44928]|uniref:Major facilitator superfamily MFS_1 n=1 Tax=Catenulispora acidiphila (strain DSM 44928 / JCM 14897 / NBRC 102108 / NRRL B-24433 / ID139908) TaxID=479433 RepID=C7QGF7_CATAD|nr:MFS transporter [Catenulispora acidiphila]ACU73002.1 major facilitator superfamily MFS_1 [Catenulispora acidiphila DSM 44928]